FGTVRISVTIGTLAGGIRRDDGLMRLFLYGTLLDANTLAAHGGNPNLPTRLVPAILPGWQRVAWRAGPYPTLRRHRANAVHGAVLIVAGRALTRLAAYEGPAYRLTRVV